MFNFIIQYWVQFLLTLITGGLGVLCRKFWKMYKNEVDTSNNNKYEELKSELKQIIQESVNTSKEGDIALQNQIDLLQSGVLSLLRQDFIEECHRLLKEEHEITVEEFEEIQQDYEVYASLGGNGQGKKLYDFTCKKASNNLTDAK